jgi:DNA-binding NarL/FixJ family response regulator
MASVISAYGVFRTPAVDVLTTRESEVLDLMVEGPVQRGISARLNAPRRCN